MIKLLRSFIEKIRSFLGKYDVTMPYFLTLMGALILVVLGINGFIELTDRMAQNNLKNFDDSVFDFIISRRTPFLTEYFTFVTDLGDAQGYIIIIALSTLLSVFVFKKWKYFLQIVFVMAISSLSNLVLKRFINRARPDLEHLVTVESLSYPSGHAMAAMAFYGFVAYLFYKFKIRKAIKYPVIFILGALILSIGVSRIYLGVHYPSDIIGGFTAGAIWVIFCIILFNLIEVFRRDPKTLGSEDKIEETKRL